LPFGRRQEAHWSYWTDADSRPDHGLPASLIAMPSSFRIFWLLVAAVVEPVGYGGGFLGRGGKGLGDPAEPLDRGFRRLELGCKIECRLGLDIEARIATLGPDEVGRRTARVEPAVGLERTFGGMDAVAPTGRARQGVRGLFIHNGVRFLRQPPYSKGPKTDARLTPPGLRASRRSTGPGAWALERHACCQSIRAFAGSAPASVRCATDRVRE